MAALAGVVVNDVENHLDAGLVQPRDHRLELDHRVAKGIAGLGREEAQRVVTPVVAQAFRDQMAVIDRGVDG